MPGLPETVPETMRVIEISRHGGPDVLVPSVRPVPVPAPGEVLIAVSHAGVNRPDCLQRAGAYPPPPGASDLPGLEVAGVIAALGDGVTGFAVADRVVALTPGGGYAEFVTAPAPQVLPAPDTLSDAQAAAVPETFFTIWGNVFMRGRLRAGETLLIHGGASGIGTTAIQLAKAFGATVIVTAGSDARCAACRALGADHAINHRTTDFVTALKDMTQGRGADVILDMVAGDYVNRNYKAAAFDGRIVQIATLNGAEVQVDVRLLMGKRLTHTGSTLRPQSIAAKGEIARQLKDHVWPLIAAGRVKPLMDEVFALDDAWKAHAKMEAGEVTGKVVLRVSERPIL